MTAVGAHSGSDGTHHGLWSGELGTNVDGSAPWEHDNITFSTIGVDIGSSTSHVIFARLHLQRLSQGLSSRYVVVDRSIVWQSPVALTPYAGDRIDVAALRVLMDEWHVSAGVSAQEVDTGAVILTGEALKRQNAKSLASLFAKESGRFVCAQAGHHREAALAAAGSGAQAHSAATGQTLLHVDVGGGTTKFAVIKGGTVTSTAAVEVGGRLLTFDVDRRVVMATDAVKRTGDAVGVRMSVGEILEEAAERALVDAQIAVLLSQMRGESPPGLARSLLVTDELQGAQSCDAISFSGGVAEYIYGRARERYGDLGLSLGHALRDARAKGEIPLPVVTLERGIRATVIGVSQYSVQLSGNTLFVSEPATLPLRNVPVGRQPVRFVPGTTAQEVARQVATCVTQAEPPDGAAVAVAIMWSAPPSHGELRALADGIGQALGATSSPNQRADGAVVILLDADLGASLGALLTQESGIRQRLVCLDGIRMERYDFVDIGEVVYPGNVVPVVVKSLEFGEPGSRP